MVYGSLISYLVLYQHEQLFRSLKKVLEIPFIGIFIDEVIFLEVEVLMGQEMIFY